MIIQHKLCAGYVTDALCALFFAVAAMVIVPSNAEAAELSDYTVGEVMANVGRVYDRIETAQGVIVRISDESEGDPERAEGRFVVRRPDNLMIEFGGDVARRSVFDGETFRLFFRGDNRGVFTETSGLTSRERYVLGAGPYFGNILPSLADGHTITLHDLYEGQIILRAEPLRAMSYSYILVGVTPDIWTVRTVEFFNSDGRLVRQKRFLKFTGSDRDMFFPTEVESLTLLGGKVRVETIYLNNVELNEQIPDGTFDVPGNDDTTWISQSLRRDR